MSSRHLLQSSSVFLRSTGYVSWLCHICLCQAQVYTLHVRIVYYEKIRKIILCDPVMKHRLSRPDCNTISETNRHDQSASKKIECNANHCKRARRVSPCTCTDFNQRNYSNNIHMRGHFSPLLNYLIGCCALLVCRLWLLWEGLSLWNKGHCSCVHAISLPCTTHIIWNVHIISKAQEMTCTQESRYHDSKAQECYSTHLWGLCNLKIREAQQMMCTAAVHWDSWSKAVCSICGCRLRWA